MKAAKLGNEEVTRSDRIGYLPDDLLVRILSLVPVRIAMSTSLLSKRWKSVWKMMPALVYDETCPYNGSLGFDQFCGMSLRLLEPPLLKTLDIKLTKESDSIDTLLFPNIRSTLLEITITLNSYPCRYSPIRFPNNNIDVFKTLVVLRLEDRIVLDVVDSPVCFPSLKRLHLTCVKFRCEECFCRLLSACPVLEDLFLQRLCSVGRFLYSIAVPSLLRLFVTTELGSFSSDNPSFEINAPSLEYLKILDRVGCFDFSQDMPKLVEANVSVHLPKNEKLLKALTSVEHLSMYLYPSMVLHLADRLNFNRLLHLELDTCYNFRPNLLLRLLKDCPTLRSLKINHRHWIHANIEEQPCFVSEPSSVPECLSFHLETLQWMGYGGTLEENEVAFYILKNAHCLKTATISLHSTDKENELMMIKELRTMSKASTSCQLVIES